MVGGKNPAKKDELLVYTTQMNSTFRARWLASSEVISQVRTIHLRAAEEKQNGFCRYIVANKVAFWAASYAACVVFTKTITHQSGGESGIYLPRRFAAQQISTTIHLHFGE